MMTTKQLTVACENEFNAMRGRFVRSYGKDRALLMMEVMETLLIAAAEGRDRKQRRDMVFDMFEAYNRVSTLVQMESPL